MQQQPTQHNGSSRKIAIIAVAGLLVIVLVAYAAMSKNSDTTADATPTATTSTTPVATVSEATETANNVSEYKDGQYESTGRYQSPGGSQSVDVSLTLAGGVVTAATVTANADDRESLEYQNKFISGFSQQVVGQQIATLKLDKVSGSSLTPKGFNAAVESIREDARS